MTTGKPQQMAAESNSSDDLIAELSKLMAQDAHGDRQDIKPQPATPHHDFAVRPESSASGAQVTPFAVRIPGGAATTVAESISSPSIALSDFGRRTEPTTTIARQEPSFESAPVAAAPVPSTPTREEPAPFEFDFDLGRQSAAPQSQGTAQPPQQGAPVQTATTQPTSSPLPGIVTATTHVEEHDTIADLIAAELLGDMNSSPPARTTPEPAAVAAPQPFAPASEHVNVHEPVATSEPPKAPAAAPAAPWVPMQVAPNLADRQAPTRPTLRPVNLTPVQKTEPFVSDSFRIPPVFGLGTTPSPATSAPPPVPVAPPVALVAEPVVAPKPRAEHGYLSPVPSEPVMPSPANDVEMELDPIDEIESLIGRAVRVELDSVREKQQQTRPALETPALRTLATPTAVPQAAAQSVSSADETIMAAAAATGAEIGWVNQEDERPQVSAPRRERAPRRSGMLRAFAGPLAAVALLLAAGFGLYSVLGLGGSDGPAPVLVADTAPTKQVPEAKSPVEQLQQSVVFNEMDGVVPGAEEQLVSRDQADVNEVTSIPPTAAVTDEGLANRKVRTVTVRPDGTIVSGEDSVAGAAILPVDRPNVPAVPGAETASAELLASAGAVEPTPAPASAVPAEPVAVTPTVPLVPGTEIAVVDGAGAPVAGKTAPVPYIRPASVGDAPATGPVNAVIAPQAANSLPPPPAQNNLTAATSTQPAATIPPATNTAVAYAQLSSQRSPEDAQRVANDLSARYASLLGGARLEIVRADLGARGTFYRVRVPAASRESATQFCASVVANGGECMAM